MGDAPPPVSDPTLRPPRVSDPSLRAPRVSDPNLRGPRVSDPKLRPAPRISSPDLRPPAPGLRGQLTRAMAALAHALVRLSRWGFSRARAEGGRAVESFAQQPEHARQRAYAFGGYALIAALTFAGQLWEPNALQAYVKVKPVPLPEATVIFVRNDSSKTWKEVKVTLNGRYNYQRMELPPTRYISLPVNRFAVYDENGRASYAPSETVPRLISVECDRGRYELDLTEQP